MEAQTDGFFNTLTEPRHGYELDLQRSDLPFFTSRYEGKPFMQTCEWEPTYFFCAKGL